MTERELFEKQSILKKNEIPEIKRLQFDRLETNSSPAINEANKTTRNFIYNQLSDNGDAMNPLDDPLTFSKNDHLIAEVDRYGLPLRTVINLETGLVRSDPYYHKDFLDDFYSKYYRNLYSNNKILSASKIIVEQIQRGEYYYNFCKDFLNSGDKILEIGCGMGGILIPFKLNDFDVKGIDLGEDFLKKGNKFNLNLSNESLESLLEKDEKYDMIILSHLIEHIPEISDFLMKVNKLLNQNGKVFIAVPGIRYIHNTYNSDISIYLQNAHCWSFSKLTLNALLNQNGFKTIKCDEEICCVAEKSNTKPINIDMTKEANEIISYLRETEENYFENSTYKPSFLKRKLNSVTRRIK
jgi:2-polyprenyl-3-methyl-5-hydroxy-6-metoxy-1,4-benzoquinol methylase